MLFETVQVFPNQRTGMSYESPRGGSLANPGALNSRTTADATPTLTAAVQAMKAGAQLDELVARTVLPNRAAGKSRTLSTTWDGAHQVISRLTEIQCHVQLHVHGGSTVCTVLRMPDKASKGEQLAVAECPTLPEAVAKAAVLACLQLQRQA
jgi:hypothetical protein